MTFLRSFIFYVAFYLGTAILVILGLPLLLGGRSKVLSLARLWGRYVEWILAIVCGLRAEYRGAERIPSGPFILAAKHQSAWETMALIRFTPDFSFVMKRELMRIPLFGWYLQKAEQIAIDRSRGSTALAQVVEKSRKLFAQGRQLLIFPEGTRRPVGAPPRYKFGVARVYAETGVVCIPVALNSGLFWGRNSFLKRPGRIIVEFLEPIGPGLDQDQFFALLQTRIEEASARLTDESMAADPDLRREASHDRVASV